MDLSRAVEDFLLHGKDLFDLLRREGHDLSPLDLHRLRANLHIFEIEAADLQTLRQLRRVRSGDRAA